MTVRKINNQNYYNEKIMNFLPNRGTYIECWWRAADMKEPEMELNFVENSGFTGDEGVILAQQINKATEIMAGWMLEEIGNKNGN